jgi:hypothetical protein
MDHGTPVSGAEIGLIPRNRGGFSGKLKVLGDPYDEIRVGTQADGSFVLADVPAPVGWVRLSEDGITPEGPRR